MINPETDSTIPIFAQVASTGLPLEVKEYFRSKSTAAGAADSSNDQSIRKKGDPDSTAVKEGQRASLAIVPEKYARSANYRKDMTPTLLGETDED